MGVRFGFGSVFDFVFGFLMLVCFSVSFFWLSVFRLFACVVGLFVTFLCFGCTTVVLSVVLFLFGFCSLMSGESTGGMLFSCAEGLFLFVALDATVAFRIFFICCNAFVCSCVVLSLRSMWASCVRKLFMSACVKSIARFVMMHSAAAQVNSPQSYPLPCCGKF